MFVDSKFLNYPWTVFHILYILVNDSSEIEQCFYKYCRFVGSEVHGLSLELYWIYSLMGRVVLKPLVQGPEKSFQHSELTQNVCLAYFLEKGFCILV